jgi:hypothetical protein
MQRDAELVILVKSFFVFSASTKLQVLPTGVMGWFLRAQLFDRLEKGGADSFHVVRVDCLDTPSANVDTV